MLLEEFNIGAPFFTATGVWVCTDKGSRTICAIKVDEHDISWLSGPPYLVVETVFDENDQEGCWLEDAQEMHDRCISLKDNPEAAIPHEVAMEGMRLRHAQESRAYPYQRLLRLPRVRNGEVLHPQAAERNGNEWDIVVRTPRHELVRIPEGEFRALSPLPRTTSFRDRDRSPV